jgi:hypothetical protein
MDGRALAALERKGWLPVDVRLIGEDSDGDRAEAVKAYLEGVRMGSIAPDSALLRFLELEAKVYGLTSGKASAAKSGAIEGTESKTLTELLNFGKTRTFAAQAGEKPKSTKRGPGAPRKRPLQKVAE